MEDWEITSLMAVLEEEEVKELGRRRAKEEVKEPDSMKRSSKRKRIDSSECPNAQLFADHLLFEMLINTETNLKTKNM